MKTQAEKQHQKLLKKCANGNQKAQLQIYQKYAKAMYNTALQILKNKEVAEEVTHDAFLKAFDKLHQFREEVSFGAWLKKIVTNLSIDYLRKNRQLHLQFDELELTPQIVTTQEPQATTENQIQALKQAIAELPPGYQLIINLYVIEGFDYEEIAQILNIKQSTVRSQYVRARQKLQQVLTQNKIK